MAQDGMSAPLPLQAVLDRIDEANAGDPAREPHDGVPVPAAWLYGRRMSEVLAEFADAPSDALQIAVRGQHIERWKRPRDDYARDRAGYLQWRRDAAAYHAARLGEIMAGCGWDEASRERIGALVRKERLKADAEAQTLEDVACLVFMRWYFVPFASGRSEEELFRIVAKTGRKMSPAGRRAALALPLPPSLVPALGDVE
jgi:hypothetical protein